MNEQETNAVREALSQVDIAIINLTQDLRTIESHLAFLREAKATLMRLLPTEESQGK